MKPVTVYEPPPGIVTCWPTAKPYVVHARPSLARDLAAPRVEGAVDLEERVAAAVDGRDPAVVRELAAEAVDRVEVAARLERARDRQVVVARAEQDVDDLDRRERAVRGELAVRSSLIEP